MNVKQLPRVNSANNSANVKRAIRHYADVGGLWASKSEEKAKTTTYFGNDNKFNLDQCSESMAKSLTSLVKGANQQLVVSLAEIQNISFTANAKGLTQALLCSVQNKMKKVYTDFINNSTVNLTVGEKQLIHAVFYNKAICIKHEVWRNSKNDKLNKALDAAFTSPHAIAARKIIEGAKIVRDKNQQQYNKLNLPGGHTFDVATETANQIMHGMIFHQWNEIEKLGEQKQEVIARFTQTLTNAGYFKKNIKIHVTEFCEKLEALLTEITNADPYATAANRTLMPHSQTLSERRDALVSVANKFNFNLFDMNDIQQISNSENEEKLANNLTTITKYDINSLERIIVQLPNKSSSDPLKQIKEALNNAAQLQKRFLDLDAKGEKPGEVGEALQASEDILCKLNYSLSGLGLSISSDLKKFNALLQNNIENMSEILAIHPENFKLKCYAEEYEKILQNIQSEFASQGYTQLSLDCKKGLTDLNACFAKILACFPSDNTSSSILLPFIELHKYNSDAINTKLEVMLQKLNLCNTEYTRLEELADIVNDTTLLNNLKTNSQQKFNLATISELERFEEFKDTFRTALITSIDKNYENYSLENCSKLLTRLGSHEAVNLNPAVSAVNAAVSKILTCVNSLNLDSTSFSFGSTLQSSKPVKEFTQLLGQCAQSRSEMARICNEVGDKSKTIKELRESTPKFTDLFERYKNNLISFVTVIKNNPKLKGEALSHLPQIDKIIADIANLADITNLKDSFEKSIQEIISKVYTKILESDTKFDQTKVKLPEYLQQLSKLQEDVDKEKADLKKQLPVLSRTISLAGNEHFKKNITFFESLRSVVGSLQQIFGVGGALWDFDLQTKIEEQYKTLETMASVGKINTDEFLSSARALKKAFGEFVKKVEPQILSPRLSDAMKDINKLLINDMEKIYNDYAIFTKINNAFSEIEIENDPYEKLLKLNKLVDTANFPGNAVSDSVFQLITLHERCRAVENHVKFLQNSYEFVEKKFEADNTAAKSIDEAISASGDYVEHVNTLSDWVDELALQMGKVGLGKGQITLSNCQVQFLNEQYGKGQITLSNCQVQFLNEQYGAMITTYKEWHKKHQASVSLLAKQLNQPVINNLNNGQLDSLLSELETSVSKNCAAVKIDGPEYYKEKDFKTNGTNSIQLIKRLVEILKFSRDSALKINEIGQSIIDVTYSIGVAHQKKEPDVFQPEVFQLGLLQAVQKSNKSNLSIFDVDKANVQLKLVDKLAHIIFENRSSNVVSGQLLAENLDIQDKLPTALSLYDAFKQWGQYAKTASAQLRSTDYKLDSNIAKQFWTESRKLFNLILLHRYVDQIKDLPNDDKRRKNFMLMLRNTGYTNKLGLIRTKGDSGRTEVGLIIVALIGTNADLIRQIRAEDNGQLLTQSVIDNFDKINEVNPDDMHKLVMQLASYVTPHMGNDI